MYHNFVSGTSSASPAFSPPIDPCGAIAAASIAAHDRAMDKMARAKAEAAAAEVAAGANVGDSDVQGLPPKHGQQASIMKSNSATPASLKSKHSWSGRRTPSCMAASPRWERCSSAASSAVTAPQPTRSDQKDSVADLNVGDQQGFREDPLGLKDFVFVFLMQRFRFFRKNYSCIFQIVFDSISPNPFCVQGRDSGDLVAPHPMRWVPLALLEKDAADDQLDWDDQHIACSLEAMVLNQPDVRRRAGSESARRGVNDSARSSTLAS
jgi:hypothetical protein